jgi:hypothetical protein
VRLPCTGLEVCSWNIKKLWNLQKMPHHSSSNNISQPGSSASGIPPQPLRDCEAPLHRAWGVQLDSTGLAKTQVFFFKPSPEGFFGFDWV